MAALDAALDAARGGDAEAFADVYRALQPTLLRYLRLLAGADAEDVAAETWVSAVRSLPTFQGDGGAFRAWLLTVGRHRWADEQRQRVRTPATAVPDVPEPRGEVAADPADVVATDEATRAALVWISTLPSAQAEAVYLRAVLGLDVAVVAELTGRSPGAVRVLAHRGLRTLAARLADSHDGPHGGR
jgi:RNA polymerase sigma-70 factor, ECF subfamily